MRQGGGGEVEDGHTSQWGIMGRTVTTKVYLNPDGILLSKKQEKRTWEQVFRRDEQSAQAVTHRVIEKKKRKGVLSKGATALNVRKAKTPGKRTLGDRKGET